MNKMANRWKPIELDGALFSGGIDGLVGIEECNDYDLNVLTLKASKHKLKVQDEQITIKKCKTKSMCNAVSSIKSEQALYSPSKSGTTIDQIKATTVNETFHLEAWESYGLPQSVLQGLVELGFTQPTPIQSLTLPAAILGRRDILGAAETGSGKTLAFGLPILSGILKIKEKCSDIKNDNLFGNKLGVTASDSEESDFENEIDEKASGCVKVVNNIDLKFNLANKPLYALILTPTRELALQIKNHLTAVAKYTGINVAVLVGGMAAVKQERILSKGPEIVVATPGRLWELIESGNLHLSQIDDIRYLAIDETDRMLERGHFQEIHNLLERINIDETKRTLRQNFVFSATLTLIHELPNHLKFKKNMRKSKNAQEMTAHQKLQRVVGLLGITNPKVVDITEGKGTSETLTECRITCKIEEKDFYLYYFLRKHPGRTLIFCNSIGCVKRLSTLLALLDCHPLPIHASMQQRQRIRNLERFRDNVNSILIATDVAARGLDIPHVEHVLHYQTPRTSESYVHRSGRTARASRQGITVLLIEPDELQRYLRLCKTLGKTEDFPIFPIQQNYLNAVKQRVILARELDKLQLQVRKANSEAGWFEKAAEDMDIIVDDMARKYDTKEAQIGKKAADIKRKQLASLLAKPIFPKGYNGNYPLDMDLNMPLVSNDIKAEKAIDVMKCAMEKSRKEKTSISLYKPRIKNKQKVQQDNIGSFKLGSKNNKPKIIKSRRSHKKYSRK